MTQDIARCKLLKLEFQDCLGFFRNGYRKFSPMIIFASSKYSFSAVLIVNFAMDCNCICLQCYPTN